MEGENEDACSEIRRLCKVLKEGQERIERILDRIPDRTEYFKQLKKRQLRTLELLSERPLRQEADTTFRRKDRF
ncbi:hypothetical protein [Salibacterium aidingense]|uniref:hypothetical protein n=1 Tax=Salibacterium aidingense TaxID=384933 RepID=UPI003BD6C30E